ncbi:MAG: iron ABC transporter permease [Oscillospiraceae bacterium]|nr:iron ABC transporter permease [Oscillospiraceae bacterium]
MRFPLKVALCALAALAVLLLSVGVGSVSLGVGDIFAILLNKLLGAPLPEGLPATYVPILWTIRLPRVALAFVVGAMLSVSGTVMQSVLRNPLASSYTLGVSSGASVGAAAVLLTGFTLPVIGAYTLPLVGLICGLLAVVCAVAFAQRVDRGMQTNTIILAGMVFSLFINALLTLLYAFAGEAIQRLINWQMGSFSMKGWTEVGLLTPIALVGILLLVRYSRELDMMTFGESEAGAMGVETRRVKWLLLGLSAALTGSAVAFAGVIGFIDLIAPHVVRRLFGARHQRVIPLSALFGGAFTALCDMAARTVVAPLELPVGAVTALIGAPFFAYVYFGRRKRGGSI